MYIKKVKIFNKELKNFKRIQKSFYLKISIGKKTYQFENKRFRG